MSAKRVEVRLGRTGYVVNKNGFGALPIQRVSTEEAIYLLHKAKDGGMNLFDTARFYTDSEKKIGKAFKNQRDEIILTTKTMATTVADFWSQLTASLHDLQTDYIDIYQFHNIAYCPKPDDGIGLYEAMLQAKEKGMIRYIGITNHRTSVANEAIESGLYDSLQFPFSYLATEQEVELVKKCKEKDMGFIAMKALAGGLLTNTKATYAYLAQFDNVVPIWGIQKEQELDEFLGYIDNPPEMTEELQRFIDNDRKILEKEFCRGCGYCMPCPVGIEIMNCARMSLLIRRSPSRLQLSPQAQAKMRLIEDCLHCGQCKAKCPYHLDTPTLLAKNYEDYKNILAGKTIV